MDANGRSMAYVYGHADPRDVHLAKALWCIATNIAKLPTLLGKG